MLTLKKNSTWTQPFSALYCIARSNRLGEDDSFLENQHTIVLNIRIYLSLAAFNDNDFP